MAELPLYQHEELQNPELLRILKLKSAEPGTDSIDCDILLVSPQAGLETEGRTYEALSWTWGRQHRDKYIRLHQLEPAGHRKQDKVYQFKVSDHLFRAFKALRHSDTDRYLWVDFICINQQSLEEKNKQVPRMDQIYGGADNVCVWLGPGSESSNKAMEFIRDEVTKVWNFDELCEKRRDFDFSKWEALVELMKREWFSRRWVVQEIALAHHATVHCGDQQVPWIDFANAIALLVEAESANSRLSKEAREDKGSGYLPAWFDTVPSLGAAIMVETTSSLFRTSPTGQRERLSTLENLVSQLPIFATSEPRDTIYALLAMAKDSSPQRESIIPAFKLESRSSILPRIDRSGSSVSSAKSLFPVKEWLRQASITSTTWSQISPRLWSDHLLVSLVERFPSLAPRALALKSVTGYGTLTAKEARAALRFVTGHLRNSTYEEYIVDYKQSVLDVYSQFIRFSILKSDPVKALDILCRPWAPPVSKRDEWRFHTVEVDGQTVSKIESRLFDNELNEEIPLPSWIPSASGAPFAMTDERRTSRASGNSAPSGAPNGYFVKGMKRINPDALVGYPDSHFRPYSAAGTRGVNRKILRFRKRPDHYSMFVEGFVLDTIGYISSNAPLGNIPRAWLAMANYADPTQDPPDVFWRTLVADRGPHGRNPPLFYQAACREVVKHDIVSATIDTTNLIEQGGSSIVTQFLKRVQAVIFNKSLIRTTGRPGGVTSEQHTRLGLACQKAMIHDKICILYGCSVPVILRERTNPAESVKKDSEYDMGGIIRRVRSAIQQSRESRVKWEQERRRAGLPDRRRTRHLWRRLYMAHTHLYWCLPMAGWAAYKGHASLAATLLIAVSMVSAGALLPFEASDVVTQVRRWWEWIQERIVEVKETWKKERDIVQGGTSEVSSGSDGAAKVSPTPSGSPVSDEQQQPAAPAPRLRNQAQATLDIGSKFSIPLIEFLVATSLCPNWLQTLPHAIILIALASLCEHQVIPENIRQMAKGVWRVVWTTVIPRREIEYHPSVYYEFIGEAYIHGMMNGEAIKWQNENGVKAQVFELR